jgi:hypothetical protein
VSLPGGVTGPVRLLAVVVTLLLGALAAPVGQGYARQADPAAPAVTPVGATAQAGPWALTVGTVQTGDEAVAAVTAISSNPAPADGETYSLVQVTATNTSDRPQLLEVGDFGLLGDGWAGRRGELTAPDPALAGTVAPGETLSGAVALAGPAGSPPTLLRYDSLSLPVDWADATLALVEGATLPAPAAGTPTDAGTDVDGAVAQGDPVATSDWTVAVREVVVGDPVFDLYPDSDYRTTALGRSQAGDLGDANDDGAAGWVAVRVAVTYTGPVAGGALLDEGAFALAQADGEGVPDGLTLTAPEPEAEGWYAPGQEREGWVVFEVQIAWDTDAMRFQASRTDGEPRYLLIY